MNRRNLGMLIMTVGVGSATSPGLAPGELDLNVWWALAIALGLVLMVIGVLIAVRATARANREERAEVARLEAQKLERLAPRPEFEEIKAVLAVMFRNQRAMEEGTLENLALFLEKFFDCAETLVGESGSGQWHLRALSYDQLKLVSNWAGLSFIEGLAMAMRLALEYPGPLELCLLERGSGRMLQASGEFLEELDTHRIHTEAVVDEVYGGGSPDEETPQVTLDGRSHGLRLWPSTRA